MLLTVGRGGDVGDAVVEGEDAYSIARMTSTNKTMALTKNALSGRLLNACSFM
jgi:hypothetical protein